ncbi:MAG: LysM peptidoglycan-binding domain-containing protein [Pseudomonadota bacterium]|nr:LysM peptidoglycan-binding domain-containing protein [Pseudomonadota bacterium]
MPAKKISTLLLLSAMSSGCSSIVGSMPDWVALVSGESDSPLESRETNPAAGDEALKAAVAENNKGQDEPQAADTTALDSAIDPELQQTAESAREKLDSAPGNSANTRDDDGLWGRLREGFALDHSVNNERVRAQLDWYVSHRAYINRVVERGRRYLYHIIEQVEARGLPTELALLPVVESAFDPFAYSHGRAAGLWQFIPSTGKYFGLTQSWWHDDRRDILAGTDAALTYLERLSDRFDGDFTLALAAYNSGGGTVSSAMRRSRNASKPTDFWSLELPRETRHYVPKLIALAKIFDNPEKYGIELPPVPDQPYFEVVDTGSQIDLAQAAELAGLDIDEIYLLNPSFNRWATNPDGPHRLLVPVDSAEQFRRGIAGLDPKQRVTWEDYNVVSGDSLLKLSHQFNTTVDVIRDVNSLDSNIIRVGQKLMIPVASRSGSEYALSAAQRLQRKQSRSAGRDGTRVEHQVQPGDTFWDIARDHRVSVRQVAAWNGMAPGDRLMPGQKLVIWSKTAHKSTTVASRRNGVIRKVGYQVRKGDSLAAIASRFAVNVSDIASWNDLNTSRYLQPGQSLVLYVDVRNSP